MNFCKISQNATILRILNCYVSNTFQKIVTVDSQQITQSSFQVHEFKEKCDQFYTHLLKDLKDLSLMLSWLRFMKVAKI